MTAVSPTQVIDRIRTAKKAGTTIPVPRLTAYYDALSQVSPKDGQELKPIETEELIHTPGRGRIWWPPTLCFLTAQGSIFGDSRAYLGQFRGADSLWTMLGIRDTPDLKDLKELWVELSGSTPSPQIVSQLDRSYFLANKLAATTDTHEVVPLWADIGWKDSNEVVATDDEELWEALESLGLPRWQQQRSQALQQFTKYCGVVSLEQATSFELPNDVGSPCPLEESVLRLAVKAFAADAARLDSTTWRRISPAIRKWAGLKVARIDNLALSASISLPGKGLHSFQVQRKGFLTDDTLYLSGAVSLEDPPIASALLSDPGLADLSPTEFWNLGNALRVKLLEAVLGIEPADPGDEIFEFDEEPEDIGESFSDLFDDPEPADDTPSQSAQSSGAKDAGGAPDDEGETEANQAKPKPEPCPVDEYEVLSDVRGGKPGTPGRRGKDRKITLRRPGHTKAGKQRESGQLVRSPATVEERGVALFIKHVLEPENIRVVDQRPRKGVGADILGDDKVFRELKTFSRRAPGQLSLTRHEAARAQAEAQAYELVIAEELWGDATITIISDPLSVLDSFRTGKVVVTDWRQKLNIPETRVVTLQRTAEDSGEDSNQ